MVMLARAAANFYWMGRYLERTRHSVRLIRYPLARLVDQTADDIALDWQVVYRALDQTPPGTGRERDPDRAEAFLLADAYTLAGSLIEESANPDSVLSCWSAARTNARQVRSHLPLPIWTCLNQGYLWLRDSDFPAAWAIGPVELVREAHDRLHLLDGLVEARMYRDDAWRFAMLGRYIERTQHQIMLIRAWLEVQLGRRSTATLPWADLLRMCGVYETYCRRHAMEAHPDEALSFLLRDPELPRSLRYSLDEIGRLLAGIDPAGGRYPLAPPHRRALRLGSDLETNAPGNGDEQAPVVPGATFDPRQLGRFLQSLLIGSRELHDLVMETYVDFAATRSALA